MFFPWDSRRSLMASVKQIVLKMIKKKVRSVKKKLKFNYALFLDGVWNIGELTLSLCRERCAVDKIVFHISDDKKIPLFWILTIQQQKNNWWEKLWWFVILCRLSSVF